MNLILDQMKAVLFGHAVGDALGVPAEFQSRSELQSDPVDDMYGGGAHGMPAGAWSDDTSMALCALKPLAGNKVDFDEIMKNFGLWYFDNKFTPTGVCFDSGVTCGAAISNYMLENKPYWECGFEHESSNGNGSLMRIYPFVLYAATRKNLYDEIAPQEGATDLNAPLRLIHAASALTHAHLRSEMACGIYAYILWALLKDPSKEAVVRAVAAAEEAYRVLTHTDSKQQYLDESATISEMLHPVLDGTIKEEDIKSFGYVLNTLQIAVWCLLTTSSYEQCVLKAVNLGHDTDTNAAVAGSLAGALYGYDAIPKKWLNALIKRPALERLVEKAYNSWSADPEHSIEFRWK